MGTNQVRTTCKFSPFDPLPVKILQKILSGLPLDAKKRARSVCKNWNQTLLPLVNFSIPELNDMTVKDIANFSQDLTELRVSSLILPIPMTLSFHHGYQIRKIIFEDPNISEENMIWIMTKCYSIREIHVKQIEPTGSNSFVKIGIFLSSKNIKIINMASRTLRSLQVIGQEIQPIEKIPNSSTNHEKEVVNYTFDCAILRDCTSLQSFIIINFPFLELKNLQNLPSSLAHLALEAEFLQKNTSDHVMKDSLDSSVVKPNKKLVTFGFIDFSSPIPLPVKTFQYVIRLTRLKRFISRPIDGQKLFDSCLSIDSIFYAIWNTEIGHYQIRKGVMTMELEKK